MITREMLIKKADEYDRKKKKYPEEFYCYHLDILKNTNNINELVRVAVRNLLLWKLGKIRSTSTTASEELNFKDSEGNRYYSSNTTSANKKAIEKACEEEMLKIAIDFKDRKVSYSMFKDCTFKITTYDSSIVLPAFYVHMWCPSEYPILDDKVWKIFCKESNMAVKKYTKPRSWAHYKIYTNFFKKLVQDTGLNYRIVDKGLWVLGDEHKKIIKKKVQHC